MIRLATRVVLAAAVLVPLSMSGRVRAGTGEPDPSRENAYVHAAASTDAPKPEAQAPPPPCSWTDKAATQGDLNTEKGFWRWIDGGGHYEDVLVFFEDGTLRRTWVTSKVTYVLQVRVCDDPTDPGHGDIRWAEVGPPNPELLWDELSERVTRRVPLPAWELGMAPDDDGTVRVFANLGLWISVSNADDVVARAEPAPGVWAETRATLESIRFDPGNGAPPVTCAGAGTPLPADHADTTDEGPCGYTYDAVGDLGARTAGITATWSVRSSASTGNSEVRPDIVLQIPIPIEVDEIQTVGVG